jgi:gliding motility-associated-like protein
MNKIYIKLLSVVKVILFTALTISVVQAQDNHLWQENQAYNWCFGFNCGLSFDTGAALPFSNAAVHVSEGSASISDANGELLFYAASGQVWDKSNQVMQNGAGLLGFAESSTQGGIIVPKPGNPDNYYLFGLSDITLSPTGLSYSVIDMTLNNGYGGVTTDKNVILNGNAFTEKITAVHHANGTDVWLISHVAGSNEFVAYLITADGIAATPVTSAVGFVHPDMVMDPTGAALYDYAAGQMKASPDGSRLAVAIPAVNLNENKGVQVFDFDNATGQISNPIFFPTVDGAIYGLEFSPDGSKLYVAESIFLYFIFAEGKLQQYDMNAGDETAIINSKTTVGDLTGTQFTFTAFQAGPDGRVYICNQFNSHSIHVINYPNNAGLSAGFQSNSVSLGSASCVFGLPTMIQSYFESGILHEGECPNQEVTFSTVRIPGITSITWDFGDPDSGAANTSNQALHAFSGPGTYTVTAQITSNGNVQTATTQVVIIAGPDAVVPDAALLTQCANVAGTAVFDLTQLNSIILNGQDATSFSLNYYASQADADANNAIAGLTGFTTAGQTIYAGVTSIETGCRTLIAFDLVVNPLPVVVAPEGLEQCGDLAGMAQFNLNTRDAIILNGQNAADYTITYYTDENASNAISEPEAFTSSGQPVYVKVVNNATGCTAITSFAVEVTQASLVPENVNIEGCSPFDLTLVTSQLEAGLTLSFYTTEEDALAETNAIAAPGAHITANNTGTVYIVAKNGEGCADVGPLQLVAGDCLIPKGISPNGDTLNDTFDLTGFDVQHLCIFNRYGQEVFTAEPYTDQWHGQGSNGDELPTGTYYYMIKLAGGESKTGWVYINREIN